MCVHNSARSQMAEEYLRKFAGEHFEAESAGLQPGAINPLVAEALLEEGIDIRSKQTHSVLDFHREGRRYDYVIAVCSKEAAERCPVFPGAGPVRRLHWPFDDPSQVTGSPAQKMARVREIRDQIKAKVLEFVAGEGPATGATGPVAPRSS